MARDASKRAGAARQENSHWAAGNPCYGYYLCAYGTLYRSATDRTIHWGYENGIVNQAATITPRISMIVPAYNEEDYLPRLFKSIAEARARYRHGEDAIEVIIGDNASTDRTAEVARDAGCKVAYVEKRMIGAARNGAVAISTGEVLFFCDADMEIHPDTFNAIDDVMSSGKAAVGMTGIRPERWTLRGRVVAVVLLPLFLFSRVAGWELGPIFCRREDFDAIGAYSEEKAFGEDMKFLVDLKKLGRPRGRRFVRCKGVPARHSIRKGEQHGFFEVARFTVKYTLWNLFRRGRTKERNDEWIRRFWYDDRD